ncbi:flavin-containing monooxygenase [Arthrobacter castelli]|uniref:flavin-containing monooxygenase n=1 Tax=Arthrobacter castelli TaxID=271431 RepID=UPI0003FFCE5A|nr:NAD(P)/FAD-dependent oxidoreductase [Arthrobacter castelli]
MFLAEEATLPTPGSGPEHLDVVIVGAGLSGIGAAYRVQTECPSKSYAILEARDAVGGTWDLFRYPGVRSDSDMFTLGYPFRPWTEPDAIAGGGSILEYLRRTAEDTGAMDRIRFNTRLVSAGWTSAEARWSLDLEETDDGGSTRRRTVTCSFLYCCTGYYSYDHAHQPDFPGMADFGGEVVHPQFWPQELDYRNRRVVVIGSGATAVTLVPAMANDAAHVTMLQRSPGYVTALPHRDRFADAVRRRLPPAAAHALARAKNVLVGQAFHQFCRRCPGLAAGFLRNRVASILGEGHAREHFTPDYDPWDQRLCVAPGADLFHALESGDASIVTDRVASFTSTGIDLASGTRLDADVVVTATGLTMLPLGGIQFSVDGEPVDLGNTWAYRGVMLTGLPNLAVCVGYTNASWTLRADLASRYVCRLLKFMDRHGHRCAVPTAEPRMGTRPLLDLTSGYVKRAAEYFPKQGDRRPWTMPHNYLLDAPLLALANLRSKMMFDAGHVVQPPRRLRS